MNCIAVAHAPLARKRCKTTCPRGLSSCKSFQTRRQVESLTTWSLHCPQFGVELCPSLQLGLLRRTVIMFGLCRCRSKETRIVKERNKTATTRKKSPPISLLVYKFLCEPTKLISPNSRKNKKKKLIQGEIAPPAPPPFFDQKGFFRGGGGGVYFKPPVAGILRPPSFFHPQPLQGLFKGGGGGGV